MLKIPIETARLRITAFDLGMARSVWRHSLDEGNREFMPDEVFETLGEARKAIAGLIAAYGSARAPQVYPVVLKGGAQIGHVEAAPIALGWEVGYHIAAEQAGKGYATEALQAFLPAIMGELKLERIYGICRADNTASRRVLEKCGFELEFEGSAPYHGGQWRIRRYVYAPGLDTDGKGSYNDLQVIDLQVIITKGGKKTMAQPAGMRESQKRATRDRILAAAKLVCLRQGLFAPADEIAREAGVAHGTIFVHFPTREALRQRVLESLAEEMGAKLHQLAAARRPLEELLYAQIAVLEEYEPFYRGLLEGLASLPEEARGLLLGLQSTLSEHLRPAIEEGRKAGRVKELPLALLFNAWIGLLHAELFAPGQSVLGRRKGELVEGYLALIANETN
ncbi:MAG: GNAT family N-acetyltransferase [Christensenellaceae bacterium]|jgi:RimJ/RimL family protein N-acetyltransferase/AcrR family transcriptional regulator|nr:GNAT family N-acetyltransferase [Christensenellaceae bacterium]